MILLRMLLFILLLCDLAWCLYPGLDLVSLPSIVTTLEDSVLCTEMGVSSLRKKLSLSGCGCKKIALDVLGDHVSTCTAHSRAKKAHDWAVEQLADLFRKIRGR